MSDLRTGALHYHELPKAIIQAAIIGSGVAQINLIESNIT